MQRRTFPAQTAAAGAAVLMNTGSGFASERLILKHRDTMLFQGDSIAESSGAVRVPFQSVFDQAVADGASPASLAAGGVHPTTASHQFRVRAWRQAVGV